MAWKTVVNADAGDSDHFGGNDLDKISNGFSGVDVDDFDIASDFKFRNGKLQIANPANTFKYTVSTSAIIADRILTIPLTAATDTFTLNNLSQTLTQKTLDSSCIIASTGSLPSTVVTEDVSNSFDDLDQTFKADRLLLRNPADTFKYRVKSSAIVADRNITLPLLTSDGKFAFDNFTNVFSAGQKMDNYVDLKAIAEPSNPSSGYVRLFTDTADGKIKIKRSDGTVVIIE